MRQILRADYDQIHLLPASVEDWVGAEHPARFVREFVEALDLKALGLDNLKRDEGGISYEPALLLSVWQGPCSACATGKPNTCIRRTPRRRVWVVMVATALPITLKRWWMQKTK